MVRNKTGLVSLQLKSVSDLCAHCHACTENCPMSLPVEKMVSQEMMENKECILCGTCVDGCAEGAISFIWGKADLDKQNKPFSPDGGEPFDSGNMD